MIYSTILHIIDSIAHICMVLLKTAGMTSGLDIEEKKGVEQKKDGRERRTRTTSVRERRRGVEDEKK